MSIYPQLCGYTDVIGNLNNDIMDSDKGEKLAKWYLRFNGYFIVDNFIVHAADNQTRISGNIIGNHTETDILGLRNKFSKEVTGKLNIKNDDRILDDSESLIDFVIVEVKTGNANRPNKAWRDKDLSTIKYIIRFAGFVETEEQISNIAIDVADKGIHIDPDKKFSIRLVLISEAEPNKHWKHLSNVLFRDIIDFIVNVRGGCWEAENIGVASLHEQWDDLINEIFEIANNHTLDPDEKVKAIFYKLQP
jgi:hypothetical protein